MKSSLEELLDEVRDAEDVVPLLLKLRWFAEEHGVISHRVQDLINNTSEARTLSVDLEAIYEELDVFHTDEAIREIRRMIDEIDSLHENVKELGESLERAEAEIARLNEGA